MDVFFLILSGLVFYISCFIAGAILGTIYLLLEEVFIYFYSKIKKIFFPLPQFPSLPQEIREQAWQEAADFVHAKHRVGEYEYFHEYIWVAAEYENKKYNEFFGIDSTIPSRIRI